MLLRNIYRHISGLYYNSEEYGRAPSDIYREKRFVMGHQSRCFNAYYIFCFIEKTSKYVLGWKKIAYNQRKLDGYII